MKFKFEIIPNNRLDDDYSLIKKYEYDKEQKGGAGFYEMFRGTKEECQDRKRELLNGRKGTNKINKRRTSENGIRAK